ncbi:MAG TPA: insulinase family protein [Dysgonamonadaceae bacterium]|nr:insulinase family protein [Dysgonamonadaceae bacterium]
MRKLYLLAVLLISLTTIAQQNPPQPMDPTVRHGQLENGLTYFIRQNKQPENRADFYIAQKVGSMQEEDSQAGLAHFLEHMAFNGTKHFPKKEMLNWLEENGVKFGENVNAYTSFDETVYYLSNVPVTREGIVDSALLILHDWSSEIALEGDEIESERGVIREEWRTRGGSQFRLWEKMLPVMFKDSKYANRLPIGDIDVINNFEYNEIRDYYEKWYRPDLQGIIIVGDIDPDRVEAKVKELFSKIEMPEDAAEREYYPVPDNEETLVSIATDRESTGTSLMVFYKHDPIPDEIKLSQAGFVINYIKSVASTMVNDRFQEIIQKPNAPFTYAYAYDGDYFVAKTKDAWTVVASSADDKIKDALSAMIRETERMKKFGFTESEYERARENIIKNYENTYNNRDKQQNRVYSQEYVSSFINNEPFPGIEYEYNMIKMIAPSIPVDAINQTIAQLIQDKNIVISISGPEKEELIYPTEQEILDTVEKVKAEEIEAYVEEVSDELLITTLPTAGKTVQIETNDDLDATVWTLSNGMKVILKKTDFKDDQILMIASSVGGTSQYAEQDPINSKMMGNVMTLGGVGNFSVTNLRKVLAGKTASATPTVSLTTQGFNGSSSIKDFETMLQLVYLYFTSPRSDKDAFDSFIERMESQLKNIEAEPMVAFSDSAMHALYGDNPMVTRTKLDDLKKIDYDKVMKMYKQTFFNPGSFVFTFVGNVDEENIKPVVETYLASLPGEATEGEFIRVPMDVKTGKSKNVFEKEMENPKASVFNVFTGETDRTLRNTILMSMFDQILDIVYTEKIREDEGGTYGVSTRGNISRYPKNQTILQIVYDTDPAKMEHLNTIVHKELRDIAANGPREADFKKVKEFMNKKHNEDLKENSYWIGILNTYYFYGEDNHTDYLETLNSVTMDDVKKFADELLSQDNEIIVSMMPKEVEEGETVE